MLSYCCEVSQSNKTDATELDPEAVYNRLLPKTLKHRLLSSCPAGYAFTSSILRLTATRPSPVSSAPLPPVRTSPELVKESIIA